MGCAFLYGLQACSQSCRIAILTLSVKVENSAWLCNLLRFMHIVIWESEGGFEQSAESAELGVFQQWDAPFFTGCRLVLNYV